MSRDDPVHYSIQFNSALLVHKDTYMEILYAVRQEKASLRLRAKL